jgi:glycosyltransferase involved in cell wall biosynthesis
MNQNSLPLVTVIMTTYNSSKNVSVSIPSILNQVGKGEMFDLELIAIDNCSTDNTCDILKEMGVTYFRNAENSGGPNKGRNLGFSIAKGDFICMMDDDDKWHPEKIKSQLEAIGQHAIITTAYHIENTQNGKKDSRGVLKAEATVYPKNEAFLRRLSKSNNPQPTYMSTVMFRVELRRNKFEEDFGMLDYDWWLRMFEGQSSIHINKPLVTRFITGQNISRNEQFRWKDHYYALYVYEFYRAQYPTYVAKGTKQLNGSMGRFYYSIGEMKKARHFFLKDIFRLKNLLYIITSFAGNRLVNKRFNVSG